MQKTAFIFPGQGSQYVGMGKELRDNFQAAREVFEEANDSFHYNISTLCSDGPESELKLTYNTQPAVLTVSVAALRVLLSESAIQKADLLAGHSLGEYTGLIASGSLTFFDGINIVHKRGKFMQEAVPVGEGVMAAILGMDSEEVEDLCRKVRGNHEVLNPANFNCPGQVVIAGHTKAVKRAVALVEEERKAKGVILPVSAPFHCSLMKPAGERLAKELAKISLNDLQVPVVSNVEAKPNASKDRVKDLLVKQVDNPVRWEESITNMISQGIKMMIEIGPGRTLSGLTKRINREITLLNIEDVKSLKRLISAT